MKRTCFSRQAPAATLAILMLAGLLAMPMGASESAETPLPILHVDALTERADAVLVVSTVNNDCGRY